MLARQHLTVFCYRWNPFCLPSQTDPRIRDPWHHCDPTEKPILVYLRDALIKQHIYLAMANRGLPIDNWEEYEMTPPPPPPPIIPVVVVREAEASEPTVAVEPAAEVVEPVVQYEV